MKYDPDYDRYDKYDRDDNATVIYNDRVQTPQNDDIPQESKELLGERPEDGPRPIPRGMSRTQVANTETDFEMVSVSDMSEDEIFEYFEEQAKVCTVNQFRQLMEKAYAELLDGANMLLMGAKAVRYIEDHFPHTSASLKDYLDLYRYAHKEANALERMGWPNYRKARR